MHYSVLTETSFTDFDVNKENISGFSPVSGDLTGSRSNEQTGAEQIKGITPDNQIFSDLQDFVKATLEANDEDIAVSFQSGSSLNVEAPKVSVSSDNKGNLLTEDSTNKSNDTVTLFQINSKSKTDNLKQEVPVKRNHTKVGKGTKALTEVLKRRKKKKRGLFKCEDCKCTFRLLGAFNNHKKSGKCLFVCNHCGKQFTSRYYWNYVTHMKYHSNERQHKCDICGKAYIEAHTLKIHMRKHSGERPFVCDYCGKAFFLSSQLVSHKNSTHKESTEIHKCDICGQVLSTFGNLRQHKRVVHSTDRPFTCETCGKSFKTNRTLEVHSTIHQEVFPFTCDFPGCDKTFKRAESLANHARRHRNDRTHFCDQCGKGFYSSKDLKEHVRTHTGEKPFSCDICGYKCALAGNLKKHLKTHKA